MMDKDKLRKADIFSGALIVFLGLFIISQAAQMPMKDSWGGVQNVWFVSPALFPLMVGGMLAFLGGCLIAIALRSTGKEGIQSVVDFLTSRELTTFLKRRETVRFYAIVYNLIVFVFLVVPHIDFFLASIFFLLVFFVMFYFGDHAHLLKIFFFLICCSLLLVLFLVSGLHGKFTGITEFGGDWLVLLFIVTLGLLAGTGLKGEPEIQKKYRVSIVIAIAAPLTIGIVFKYFLLVPMPHEGLIVQLLDSIWYAELWS